MKTKIAILGVGRWGIHLLRNFWQHSQASVVAVIDPDPERLAFCREQLELDSRVVMATDWASVRQLEGIDAVVIATPASTHYPLIADALRLGYHVLAEKPLTLDPVEGVKLCHLAEKKQRQLFVDHTYLFHPAVARGKQVMGAGELGELRYGYATRTHLGPVRRDVDALWDLAVHDIAIFNHWLGQTPTQVQAIGSVWLQGDRERREARGERNHPFPNSDGLSDLVWVTLTYPNGFQAYIHLCWLNPDKQRRLCMVGNRGSLIFDEMLAETPLTLQRGYLEQEEEHFIPAGQSREVLEIEDCEPLRRVCDRFLGNIRSPSASSVSSGWVGVQLVQILSCLSQSLQQGGQEIKVPYLTE